MREGVAFRDQPFIPVNLVPSKNGAAKMNYTLGYGSIARIASW